MTTYFAKCSNIPNTSYFSQMNSAGVFFDRDGTIIMEKHYLRNTKELEFIPGVLSALYKLQQTGLPMYIITNQAGIAHGYFNEETLNRIHFNLVSKLKQCGISLRGIYYCPHHPQAKITEYRVDCYCRKPNPGLLELASLQDGIDLSQSYMIGDKLSDLKAGSQAGTKTALVLTGYGSQEASKISVDFPDFVGDSLERIVDWIISEYVQIKFHSKIHSS